MTEVEKMWVFFCFVVTIFGLDSPVAWNSDAWAEIMVIRAR